MFPCFTQDNIRDRCTVHAVTRGYLFLLFACCGACANIAHGISGQLRAMDLFATRQAFRVKARSVTFARGAFIRIGVRPMAITGSRSAFFGHIMQVIFGCAKEEMRGVHTCTHVAGMTHHQSIGDWPHRKLIGNAVREKSASVPNGELTVPIGHLPGTPQPATAGSVNFGPKARGVVRGILGVHIDLQSMCHATSVSALRGFVMLNYTTI